MKLFFSTTLSTVLSGGIVGAGAPPDSDPQSAAAPRFLEGVDTSTLGEIRVTEEKQGCLRPDGTGGFHAYALTGKAGSTVHFVLSSQAFRTHLVIVGPTGHRWNVPGTLFVYSESLASQEIVLPHDGTYRILVTSHDNLANARAVSSGEYFLEVFGKAS